MPTRRSLEEIQAKLSEDSAWRKRELGTLGLMIQRARPHEKELLQRSAVTLAYAHWEGFVKNSLEQVMRYLARRGLKLAEVNPGLLARSMAREVRAAAAATVQRPMVDIVAVLTSDLDRACRLDTTINTKAHLSIAAFCDLFVSVGIDPGRVINAETGLTDIDIDERLLGKRNRIAHGSYVVPDESECHLLLAAVRALMDAVGDSLVAYLDSEQFLRSRD